ncbi:hypothetical protein Nepgr_007993 [Nepenthes gracilis]|uniref:Uncharacterized protein n=1 Tax=Nepenthes gracilis TaxID=150966 RepID=A0AAD3S7W2_NEPGR|nr:hypothetical protein Nepgr_007993 [Nepenthes gracilis]
MMRTRNRHKKALDTDGEIGLETHSASEPEVRIGTCVSNQKHKSESTYGRRIKAAYRQQTKSALVGKPTQPNECKLRSAFSIGCNPNQ